MAQPRFLVRNRYDKEIVQANALLLTWKKIYTSTPLSFGGGTVLEDTGKRDKTKIDVRPRETVRADGFSGKMTNWAEQIGRTAADVKQVIRALRPQEAGELDQIDVEIARLQEELKELRARRKAVVRNAWTRANVVRLSEIEEMVKD